MIGLTFWKALRCSGYHKKGVSFFINCRRGFRGLFYDFYDGGESVQVVDYSRKGLQLSKVLWEGMLLMGLILWSSSPSPSGVHVNPQNDVWSTLNWTMSGLNRTLLSFAVSVCADNAFFTFAINESISFGTCSLQISPNGSLFHLYFSNGVLELQSLLLSSLSLLARTRSGNQGC